MIVDEGRGGSLVPADLEPIVVRADVIGVVDHPGG